ncbi:HNH endonuclease [Aquimarina aggregata]
MERLDVDCGILLSPDYDALFDKHLISFENSG